MRNSAKTFFVIYKYFSNSIKCLVGLNVFLIFLAFLFYQNFSISLDINRRRNCEQIRDYRISIRGDPIISLAISKADEARAAGRELWEL